MIPRELSLLLDRQPKDVVYAHRQGACNDSGLNWWTCFDREHSDWGLGFLAKGFGVGADGLGSNVYTSATALNKDSLNAGHVENSRYAHNEALQFWPVRKEDVPFSALGGVLPDPSRPYQTAKFRVRPLLRTVNFNPNTMEADPEVNGELFSSLLKRPSRNTPRQTGWWGYSDIGILTDHKRNPNPDNVIGFEVARRGDAARYRSVHNLPCTGTNTSLVKCLPCERPSPSDDARCDVMTSRRQGERMPDEWGVLLAGRIGQFLDGTPATPTTTVGEIFPCPMPEFATGIGETRIPFDIMRGRALDGPLDHPSRNFYTCEYKSGMLTHEVDRMGYVGFDVENWPRRLNTFVDYLLSGHVAPCCGSNCWFVPPNATPPFARGMPQDFAALMVRGLNNALSATECLCRSSLEAMVGSVDRALGSAIMGMDHGRLRTELRELKSTLLTRSGADDSECEQVTRDWYRSRRPACIAEKRGWGREMGWTDYQVSLATAADCGADCALDAWVQSPQCALDGRYVRTTSSAPPRVPGQPAGFSLSWVRDEWGSRAAREGKRYKVARVRVMGTRGGVRCDTYGKVGWGRFRSPSVQGGWSPGSRGASGFHVTTEEPCLVGDGVMGQNAALCSSVAADNMTLPASTGPPGRVSGGLCVLDQSGRDVLQPALVAEGNKCFDGSTGAWEGERAWAGGGFDKWHCFNNAGRLLEITSDPRPRVFTCLALKHRVAMESSPGEYSTVINAGHWYPRDKYRYELACTEFRFNPRTRSTECVGEMIPSVRKDHGHGCLEGRRRYTYDFDELDPPKSWHDEYTQVVENNRLVGRTSPCKMGGVCLDARWSLPFGDLRRSSFGQFLWKKDFGRGGSNWHDDWQLHVHKRVAKCPVKFEDVDCGVVVSAEYEAERQRNRSHTEAGILGDKQRELDAARSVFQSTHGRMPKCRIMVPMDVEEQLSTGAFCVPNQFAKDEVVSAAGPMGRCLKCVSGKDLQVPIPGWTNSMEETEYTRTHRARVRGPAEPECWNAVDLGSRGVVAPLYGGDEAMCTAKYGLTPMDPNHDPNFSRLPLSWKCENFVCKHDFSWRPFF